MKDDALPPMAYSEIEQEAIILKAVWDMIDGMVNFAMFEPLTRTDATKLNFNSSSEARLFNILLVDFLSPVTGSRRPFDLPRQPEQSEPKSADTTFLFFLRRIAEAPRLGHDIAPLRDAVDAMATWLEGTTTLAEIYLPSVDRSERPFAVQRQRYLKLCGNIGKHNFARLEKVEKELRQILEGNGVKLEPGRAFSVLEEFYEWFHRDIFIYHSSTIAELLNNIRWAIYRYLRVPFMAAFRSEPIGDLPFYTFDFPTGLEDEIAREMWWDLMNRQRSKPYFPQFTVTQSLKQRY